jgi:hypothetical protein
VYVKSKIKYLATDFTASQMKGTLILYAGDKYVPRYNEFQTIIFITYGYSIKSGVLSGLNLFHASSESRSV